MVHIRTNAFPWLRYFASEDELVEVRARTVADGVWSISNRLAVCRGGELIDCDGDAIESFLSVKPATPRQLVEWNEYQEWLAFETDEAPDFEAVRS